MLPLSFLAEEVYSYLVYLGIHFFIICLSLQLKDFRTVGNPPTFLSLAIIVSLKHSGSPQ